MKQIPHYCHWQNGQPQITTDKPEDFENLKNPREFMCPSLAIAKRVYLANLRISNWRLQK